MQDSPRSRRSLPELVQPKHEPSDSSEVLETALGSKRGTYLPAGLFIPAHMLGFYFQELFQGFSILTPQPSLKRPPPSDAD